MTVPSTLSIHVLPIHYNLLVEPDVQHFRFKGEEFISLSIQKKTSVLVLHAKELAVQGAWIRQGKREIAAKVKLKPQEEALILTFPEAIQGRAELHLTFTGIHNDSMYGFYRSRYMHEGKEHYLVTTQFEPANARAAFPCFDEPQFKATFDVSMIVDQPLLALSNMPVKEEKKLPNNKKLVSFQRSPRMSTYLVYLSTGNYKWKSGRLGNVEIRVLTIPEKIKYADLALDYTKRFLNYFNNYFGNPYPLPKLDIIALPDFAAGAMENWGAITFREIAVLGNESTSVVVKQNIAITIAHELAHQWFGDLVTMKWWDDLWLNESFATFMSYKAVHDQFPEWELPLQYYMDTIVDALSADQLRSTHPIHVPVKTLGEIDSIFDQISYDKGGSVLHMLEDFLGEEPFRQGLRKYMRRFAYKNAAKEDLWQCLQQSRSGVPVAAMMKDWIEKPGYPLVRMQKAAQGMALSQERFTLVEHTTTDKLMPDKWMIPLTYQGSGSVQHLLLNTKSVTLPTSEWIKGNVEQHGLYRVAYEPEHLAFLGQRLRQGHMQALDAAGIVQDLFALVVGARVSLNIYLQFVERYCLNAAYPLNMSISGHLGWLYRLGYGQTIAPAIERTSRAFHRAQLRTLGWERAPTEKNTWTMMRSAAIASLGQLGEKDVLERSQQLYARLRGGDMNVDTNLRGVIYSLTAWQGNAKTYAELLERYKQEQIPEENRKLLRSLGLFQDKKILQKALDLSQSSTVRLQDSIIIPLTVSGNPQGNGLIWQWTKQQWPRLMGKYKHGTHMLNVFVHNLAFVQDAVTEKEIKKFFAKKEHRRDDIKRPIEQTLEKIAINRKFMDKNKGGL